jgi:hypothetical protein
MDPKILRIVYIAEFLLALIAVFTAWSQIGGQGHLDQMAWYLKLSLGMLISYAIVRATAAAVSEDRGWNARALRWTGIVALLAIAAGLITYYTHLYEPADEEDEQDTTQTSAYRYRCSSSPRSASGSTAVCTEIRPQALVRQLSTRLLWSHGGSRSSK